MRLKNGVQRKDFRDDLHQSPWTVATLEGIRFLGAAGDEKVDTFDDHQDRKWGWKDLVLKQEHTHSEPVVATTKEMEFEAFGLSWNEKMVRKWVTSVITGIENGA